MIYYDKIIEYFAYLESTFNLSICVKDFSGFVQINKELNRSLQPYLNHQHDFCLYVKKDRNCYFECLSMIPKILKKSVELKSTFYGTCFAGVSEYVIPIINENNVIGAITLGCFVDEEKNLENRITNVCKKHPTLKEKDLIKKLYQIRKPLEFDRKSVLLTLEIIANFLAITYKNIDFVDNQKVLVEHVKSSPSLDLMDTIIKYIKDNLNKNIKMEELALHCNYSTSYISKKFNKLVGVNLNTYINKMRVEVSKNYLLTSNKSISEISEMIGFVDASYYCKVFNQLLNMSPSEFRRRFR